MKLQAFLNSEQIKTKYVQRLESHYIHDEIIKGQYWEDGKGCAIGCTIHSDSHNCYEIELGIPEWIARLEDTLFQGMLNEYAKSFPLRLLKSIPVGFSNWQHIYHQLCIYILENECKNTDHQLVRQVICDIITLHTQESKDIFAWSAAESAAGSAAWFAAGSAGSAAGSAAWSAGFAGYAGSAAWSARYAGSAGYAGSAAWSAESAAESTTEYAGFAAESTVYKSIADKLIELLENEK